MEVHFKYNCTQLQLRKSNIITFTNERMFHPKIVSYKELLYYNTGTYYKINDNFKIEPIKVVENRNGYTLMYMSKISFACYYNWNGCLFILKLEKIEGLYCYNFVKFLRIGYDLDVKNIITTENYVVYKKSHDIYEYYDPISDTNFLLPIKECRLHSLQNNIIGCEYYNNMFFLSLPDLKYLGSIKLVVRGFQFLSLTKTTFRIMYCNDQINYYSFSDKGIILTHPTDHILEFEYSWNYNKKLLKYIPIPSIVEHILVPYL